MNRNEGLLMESRTEPLAPEEFFSPEGYEALLRVRTDLRSAVEREFKELYPGEIPPDDYWGKRRLIDKKVYSPEDYETSWGEYDRRKAQATQKALINEIEEE